MDQVLLTGLRVLSIMAAGAAGWLLGRSVPSWRIDRCNESALDGECCENSLDTLFDETALPPADGTGTAWFEETWRTGLLFTLAVGLGIWGWGEQAALSLERICTYYGANLLITRGFLVALAGAAAGYLAGVLTDQGPVGPLE